MSRTFRARRLVFSIVALGLVAAACGSVTEGLETTETNAAAADTELPVSETTSPANTADEPVTAADPDRLVAPGDLVSVHYVGTLDAGDVFDSSRERGQALSFAVASGQMIPGFDNAVLGMKVGEVKTVRLAPADAYGEKGAESLIEVPLAQVPEGTKAGDVLRSPQGQSVTVIEVNDSVVIIDTAHELAGEFLTFEIEIVSIDS